MEQVLFQVDASMMGVKTKTHTAYENRAEFSMESAPRLPA